MGNGSLLQEELSQLLMRTVSFLRYGIRELFITVCSWDCAQCLQDTFLSVPTGESGIGRYDIQLMPRKKRYAGHSHRTENRSAGQQ